MLMRGLKTNLWTRSHSNMDSIVSLKESQSPSQFLNHWTPRKSLRSPSVWFHHSRSWSWDITRW